MSVTHAELAAAGGAALVGFQQAGTGAVLRTVDQKLKEVSLSPEDFGAVGDGVTNDTDAFLALSQAINAAGGGVVNLLPKTYLVGKQSAAGDALAGRLALSNWWLKPHVILFFDYCTKPVIVRGNGARLVCAEGLKFGTFDEAGDPDPDGYANEATRNFARATPYIAMILASGCSELVTVENLELDGRLASHVVGGGWGDTGWQIPCSGIEVNTCSGGFRFDNVKSVRHALDGFMTGYAGLTESSDSIPGLVVNSAFEENGRNNTSIVGGRGYVFANTRFDRSGKAAGATIQSLPGAGVDIEAENSVIRDLSFVDCQAVDNFNVGLVADSGDSANIVATRCRFVGTTSWSVWPRKPLMKFVDCEILGGFVQTYGDTAQPERATHFVRCRFSDRQSESPTGVLFPSAGQPIGQSIGENTRFTDCAFDLTGGHLRAPHGTLETRYENVILKQTSTAHGSMPGRYSGASRFEHAGPLAFGASTFHGPFTIGGITYAATARADQVPATTPGSVVGKIPFFSESGTLLGYAPLYDAIS